jgi:hypothetical protein
MKWFRSNVRHGSWLALFALAIQVLLSFGHFHGNSAQAAPASMDADQPGLHDTVTCAAMHLDAAAGASHEEAFSAVGFKTSDHESDGRPTDDPLSVPSWRWPTRWWSQHRLICRALNPLYPCL